MYSCLGYQLREFPRGVWHRHSKFHFGQIILPSSTSWLITNEADGSEDIMLIPVASYAPIPCPSSSSVQDIRQQKVLCNTAYVRIWNYRHTDKHSGPMLSFWLPFWATFFSRIWSMLVIVLFETLPALQLKGLQTTCLPGKRRPMISRRTTTIIVKLIRLARPPGQPHWGWLRW